MALHVYLWSSTAISTRKHIETNYKIARHCVKRDEELVGKTVFFIGKFDNFLKKEASELAKIAGMTVKPTLSKSIDFVVAGKNSEKKIELANIYKVTVLSENGFLKLIHSHAAQRDNSLMY